jgi:hypothetical protein
MADFATFLAVGVLRRTFVFRVAIETVASIALPGNF